MSYGEDQAARYEDDREHMLPPGEAQAWLAEIAARSGSAKPRVLDIGAGTGLLTAVMKDAGFYTVGLEPSASMIEHGLESNPSLVRGDFVQGRAHDADLLDVGSFDWIVSRQVLCHLAEPEKAFAEWLRWLKPGGYAMLVDGFWPPSSWSERDLKGQPFASVGSAKPVADALSSAGFAIVRAGPFGELNLGRAGRWPDSTTRYVVLGRKT